LNTLRLDAHVAGAGLFTSTAAILVLFILLVIVPEHYSFNPMQMNGKKALFSSDEKRAFFCLPEIPHQLGEKGIG
jgi:hypothetical protein